MDPQRLMLLWSSILTSELAIGGVTWYLQPTEVQEPLVLGIVAAGALAPGALSLAWGRWIATEMPAQSKWLVRWALAEAVTLVALAERVIGGPLPLIAGLYAVGVAITVAQFPRSEA